MHRIIIRLLCSLALVFGVQVSMAMAAAPSAPATIDQPLSQLLPEFWPAQFGVAYEPSRSGLVLSFSGVAIEGVGESSAIALADAGGESAVETLEAVLGLSVMRMWDVNATDSGLPPGNQTVATASFSESFRSAIVELTPVDVDLIAAGLSEFSHFAVSGLFRGSTGAEQHVFGLLLRTGAVGQAVSNVAFVPFGVAGDATTATAEAVALRAAFAGLPALTQQAYAQAAPPDCAQLEQLCYDAAYLRFKACVKNAVAATTVCIGACAVGCLFSGPLYLVCMATCGASCLVAEAFALSACQDTLAAENLDCYRARLECDAASAAP